MGQVFFFFFFFFPSPFLSFVLLFFYYLLFLLSPKNRDKKLIFYSTGQVRSLSPGYFVIPLHTDKGLNVDNSLKITGEVTETL